MSDLIDRQAAIEAMAELQVSTSSKGVLKGISKAWKRIEQLPPIQPAEPKKIRGQWSIKGQAIDTVRGYWAKCSACGHSVFGGGNYCSNCGSYNKGEVTT